MATPTKVNQRSFRIEGLCCAPCTPFAPNGDINLPIIQDYVKHLVDFGVLNVFVNGTTGEGNNMTVEERQKTAEAWISEGKNKLASVIVQVGANNLRESQILACHAEKIGANAIACVGTAFYKPQTLENYVAYMQQVAAAAPDTPFILYDIDFITGINYDVSSFFNLAKDAIPTLCGVKHTSPNFVSINNTANDFPEFQTILGTDEMLLQGLSIGVEATIMNSYLGKVLNKLILAYKRGDIAEARKQQSMALAVGKIRRKYGLTFPQVTKVILQLIGLKVGDPRLPLSDITEDLLENVKTDLNEIGFFKLALE